MLLKANITETKKGLKISGSPSKSTWVKACTMLHSVSQGRQQIEIDLSDSGMWGPLTFLPFATTCMELRERDEKKFDLRPPVDEKVARYFLNADWTRLLDPKLGERSEYNHPRNSPAIHFFDYDSQNGAVNRAMEYLLATAPDLTRDQQNAIEWTLSELTDNVITHSRASSGGLLQITAQTGNSQRILEYVIADAGQGVPCTLRESEEYSGTDSYLLERAIEEGVTRNRNTNGGNGLFGSYRVALVSQGHFDIVAGLGRLVYRRTRSTGSRHQISGLHVTDDSLSFHGTVVRGSLNCANKFALSEALRFRGIPHQPSYTFVDATIDKSGGEGYTIKVSEYRRGFHARSGAGDLRNTIANILRNSVDVILDFEGVFVFSSSFADEAFGKLLDVARRDNLDLSKVRIKNLDSAVRGLLLHALTNRSPREKAAQLERKIVIETSRK